MILCLCNALTDTQLTTAVAQGARRPREVYAACECRAQCGTCTRMILSMIREYAGGGGTETASAQPQAAA